MVWILVSKLPKNRPMLDREYLDLDASGSAENHLSQTELVDCEYGQYRNVDCSPRFFVGNR